MRTGALVLASLVALTACGSTGASAPATNPPSTSAAAATSIVVSTTAASTTTSPAITTTTAAGLTHARLGSVLPVIADLPWLPPDVATSDDDDLTSRLGMPRCDGAVEHVAVDEAASTNRLFRSPSSQEGTVAEATYYSVDNSTDAHGFFNGLRSAVKCTPPINPKVTFEVLHPGASSCDESFLVLTHQPVGITIDGWCRVGRLIAWVRLDQTPNGPTQAHADALLAVVGTRLASLHT